MNNILLLKDQLNQLATIDENFTIFASDSHEYKLNPCLIEAEIQAFEIKYKITLPQDYRNFLLEVGNGGAGPGYGLLGIGYESEMTETLNEESDDFLAQPFPFKEAWNDLDLMIENEQDEEYGYFDNKFIQGTITIVHYGCGMFARLVITGEQRGNIWMDDRSNDGGIYPFDRSLCYFLHEDKPDNSNEVDVEQPLCFDDWYNDWLNKSLAAVKNYYSSP